MKDLYNNLKLISGKVGGAGDDTAFVSTIVDRKLYASVMFAIVTGVLADAGATFTALLEESDDSGMSGATAVADADMHGTEAGASFIQSDDNAVFKVGYRGNKRYIRLTVTPSGNAAADPLCILAIGVPLARPAS